MAWNQYSGGQYWEDDTRPTRYGYGSQLSPPTTMHGYGSPPPTMYGYGAPLSPPRSPSPPLETVPYEKKSYNNGNNNKYRNGNNNKYQANGMGTEPAFGHDSFFGEILPSSFPPGTDPKVISCFKNVDRDGNGFIDEKELKLALSSYSSTFSVSTIRLLMYAFGKTNTKTIGPKEFIAVYYGLQKWKAMFEKFDRDHNGKIDSSELREALRALGYPVPETILELLIVKFNKNGSKSMSIGFDGFIECCLTVKGLTDKFKEKDQMLSGYASFNYEAFMMTVLPFIVA